MASSLTAAEEVVNSPQRSTLAELFVQSFLPDTNHLFFPFYLPEPTYNRGQWESQTRITKGRGNCMAHHRQTSLLSLVIETLRDLDQLLIHPYKKTRQPNEIL